MNPFGPSVAFVDLETTGADPASDRITEIGIVKVGPGGEEYEWSTLVNPEIPIPPLIQRFTGISDAMVADAPRFRDVAQELLQRLEGSLFVAHNVRFDLGFLRNEFRRLGTEFQPQALCTVRFSRALYPHEHRHGLDAIIARHGLACSARHRALGDARVLWDFVRMAQARHDAETLAAAVRRALRTPALPAALDAALLDRLPEAPGAYELVGEQGATLYVGHGVNLRAALLSVFAREARGRAERLRQSVRDIRWQETAGVLGAELLAARWIEQERPPLNRRRAGNELCLILFEPGRPPDPAVEVLDLAQVPPQRLVNAYGVFRNRREAGNLLRSLAAAHGLDPARLGLQPAGAGRALSGAATANHDARLAAGLAARAIAPWPFPGAVAVREFNAWRERCELHVFAHWCHLGTVRDQAELAAALESRERARFCHDTYALLRRFLQDSGNRGAILDLATARRDIAA